MAIILNDNLSIQAPKAVDSRFGPYANTATALTSIITANRFQGLVVGITVGGQIVEYWFKDGTTDDKLILKVDNTANTANVLAQSAYNFANTVNVLTQSAYTQANTANTLAQGAFDKANLANTLAANSYIQANASFIQANNANTLAANSYIQANASFIQANSANIIAVSSYNAANTKLPLSGGTISGSLTIQNNLTVEGNVSFTGNVTSIEVTGNTGQFFGYASNGFNALYAGIPVGYLLEPQISVQVSSNYDGYSGINMQNINTGANASSDLFLTADNGTVNDGFVDLGIASSTYNYSGYSLIGKNDGYLFASGNTTTGGGNMIVGTGLNHDVIFSVGGINTSNEVGRFKYNTGLVLKQFPITFSDGTTQNTAAAPFARTNASFIQANSANILAANSYIQANASFIQANSANILAANSYIQANAGFLQANAAFIQANSANTLAVNSYIQANASFIQANNANTLAANSYIQANAAFDKANSANTLAANSYIQANAAFDKANSANTLAVNSYIQANASFIQANNANTLAVNSYIQANASFIQANSANTLAANSYIQANAGFLQANTAKTLAQAAYNQANTSYVSIITNNFTANGSNTFILSIPPLSSNNIIVNLNGITQLKSAYTLVGTTLTLSEIPNSDSLIDVTIFSNGSLDSAVAAIYQSGTPGQALVANTNNSIVWHNRVTKTANTTAPTDAVEGDTWLDTSTGIWSMYLVQGSGITGNGWVEFGRT